MTKRRPDTAAPTRLEVLLPLALRRRLDRLLYDPQKRRVPYGQYSQYLIGLIERDLKG